MNKFKRVYITGGGGYVGSALVPHLLADGYEVKVLDLFLYGKDVLPKHPKLELVQGDLRDEKLLEKTIAGCDALIHLACISNDPSFELDPNLSKVINFDIFEPLVKISKKAGVKRFVYASTSSVYGVSDAPEVKEDHPLLPITDYNKYKGLCEPILLREAAKGFVPVIIRPATVCGYAPRLRLDLTVNILTWHAYNTGKITVFGGKQMRPNIHIGDMVDLYRLLLSLPDEKIASRTYNAGYENHTVSDLANTVVEVARKRFPNRKFEIVTTPSDDIRSYRISSEKIKKELGFTAKRTIADAVNSLLDAFESGKVPDAGTSDKYYNIKTMKAVKLA